MEESCRVLGQGMKSAYSVQLKRLSPAKITKNCRVVLDRSELSKELRERAKEKGNMKSITNCKTLESETRDGETQSRVVQISILKRRRELSGVQGKDKTMKISDCDREQVKKPPTKKGCKILNLEQIMKAIRENSGHIEFIRVEGDVDGLVETALAPWSYKDSKKVFVIYRSNDAF